MNIFDTENVSKVMPLFIGIAIFCIVVAIAAVIIIIKMNNK